jgi:hypothetical protein
VVAYLVLSYTHPELVRRLVARLRPGGVVAVHHDDRRCALGEVDGALRVPPRPIEWGHGSQLEAVLRAVAWVRSQLDFEWLTLLSGQDYPLRPVAHIAEDLAAARGRVDAFLQHAPVGASGEFALRYRHRWRPAGARRAAVAARLGLPVRRLPSGTFVGLPSRVDGPLWHGSDWFTLSRGAVDVLLAADADHFLHTIVPTEGFAHTVLARAGLRLADDNRRFAAFTPGSANPRVIGLEDLDAAFASGGDFARKFEDVAVLDELDRRVHA